jgi:hypothetical protein
MGHLHACMHDPFLLYNHEQWALYSYNLSYLQYGLLEKAVAATLLPR